MKKERIETEIKAYLDGELDPEQVASVEEALAKDSALREEAESFNRISSSLGAFQRGPEVPANAVERAIGVAEASYRMRGVKRSWVLAVGGVFALVMFVGLVLPRMLGWRATEERVAVPAGEEDVPKMSLKYAYGSEEGGALGGMQEKRVMPSPPSTEVRSRDAGGTPSAYVAQRYVIRRASVHLKVDNVAEAERRVRSLVSLWGGFVESSDQASEEGHRSLVTMVLRVPESRFEEALSELDKLGVRTRRQTSGEDVTTTVVDYESRLRNLRAEEEAYRQIMRSARRVVDLLEVQERLSRVRGEIESLEGQLQALKRLSALSTIELTLEERPRGSANGDPNWAVDAWRRATEALVSVLRGIAVGVIWAFVYAPIWLPIVFLGALAWRFARR